MQKDLSIAGPTNMLDMHNLYRKLGNVERPRAPLVGFLVVMEYRNLDPFSELKEIN